MSETVQRLVRFRKEDWEWMEKLEGFTLPRSQLVQYITHVVVTKLREKGEPLDLVGQEITVEIKLKPEINNERTRTNRD